MMNLPSVSTGMIAQSGALQQIGISMLGKQIDTFEANASMPSPSLEASVNPSVGGNIDLRI